MKMPLTIFDFKAKPQRKATPLSTLHLSPVTTLSTLFRSPKKSVSPQKKAAKAANPLKLIKPTKLTKPRKTSVTKQAKKLLTKVVVLVSAYSQC
jgi:hypothetical protein